MTTAAPTAISPKIMAILDTLTNDTVNLISHARTLADELALSLADLHEANADGSGDSPLSAEADMAVELMSVLDDLAEELCKPSPRQAETLL